MFSLLPKKIKKQDFRVQDIQGLYKNLRKLYIDYNNADANDHMQIDCIICQIVCVEKTIGYKLKQLKQEERNESGCLI